MIFLKREESSRRGFVEAVFIGQLGCRAQRGQVWGKGFLPWHCPGVCVWGGKPQEGCSAPNIPKALDR